MSLTIKGATSGSVDVVAPASGSDVTLTLPTTTGTVLLTNGDGSSLTGVGVTGITSASGSGTAINIASTNNIGMGVADPDTGTGRKTLQIHSANDYSYLVLTNNTTGSTASSDGTSLLTCQNNFKILNRESGNIELATSGTDRLIINSAGNVGIGCSPGVNLDVESSASETYARIKNTSASGQAILILNNDVGNWQVKCDTDDSFRIRDNGNASDRLKIDTSGRVTMPNQPAFNVHVGSALGITANTWHQFVFSAERFDIGSNFSSNVFTAPITGKYQLNFFVRINNLREAAAYYQVRINTSNKNYVVTVDPGCFDSNSNYWSFSLSALADMDSNDTAGCHVYQNGGASSAIEAHETVFSGFLVC